MGLAEFCLGFVIPPGASRAVVLRGVGPSLAGFGVAGALTDARLELFERTGRRMQVNDNWQDAQSYRTFDDVGAFNLPPNSRDAVIENGGLAPGAYTVRLSGPPGVTGVGLIEIYEHDNFSDRLVNISSRVVVGPGASATPALVGFAIRGPVPKRVLVRAAGPALAAFAVAGPLANPRLEVRDERGAIIALNDDWSQQPDPEAVSRAAASAGAFAFPAGSRDAALVITLPAGNFTALVAGVASTDGGVVLVEVYELL